MIAMLTRRHLSTVLDVTEVSMGSIPGGAVRAGHAIMGTAGYRSNEHEYKIIPGVKILERKRRNGTINNTHTRAEVDIAPICS